MRRIIKSILCIILALAIMVPSFPVFADSETMPPDNAKAEAFDIESLTLAVDRGDTDYLLHYYVSVVKEYYLEHGLDKDFPYFNVDKYLELNEDVAAHTGGDRYKALVHYLEYGLFEHRSSGTAFDPYTAIARYPIILIVYTVRSAENNPELFVEYIFEAYQDYETFENIGYSDESYEDESYEDVNRKFTMLYLACTGNQSGKVEPTWSKNICRALLGAYAADDEFNLVFMLGGNQIWQSDFLQTELGLAKNNGRYKNAIYSVDKEALKIAVEEYMEKHNCTFEKLEAVVEDHAKYNSEDSILNHLVTGEVLKRETFVDSIAKSETITEFINKAKEIYPADNYGLIIGGHGGGSTSGSPMSADLGPEPQEGHPSLLIKDLGTALKKANVDDEPFSIMIYDSCLMGCSEIADYLSPYYKYMYGCETVSFRGSANYAKYFPYISSVRNNDNLAYLLAKKAFNLVYECGMKNETEYRTAAIFDPDQTASAMTSLNGVAKYLNYILASEDISDSDIRAVYNTMKLAAICSYQLYRDRGYLDLRDFLIKLKTCCASPTDLKINISLDTIDKLEDLCAEDGLLDAAIKAADELTMDNLHMFQDFYVYSSDDGNGEPVLITSELWKNYYNYQLCGASVYFPYFLLSNNEAMHAYRNNNEDNKLLYIYLEKLLDNYEAYKGQGYDEYLKLISNFIDFQFSEQEFVDIRIPLAYSLAGELNNDSVKNDDSVKVKYETYKDLMNVSVNYRDNVKKAEQCFVSVTAKDYSTESKYTPNKCSSGNVITDIMDTINTQSIKLYLTKYLECITNTKANTYVDVILATYNVPREYFNAKYHSSGDTSNLLTIPVKSFSNVKLSYISNSDKSKVDWVRQVELDKNQKTKILSNVSVINTSKIDNYVLYSGNYTDTNRATGDKQSTYYHVFDKADKNKYICTVSVSQGVGSLVENIQTITFYHDVAEKINDYSDKITSIEKSQVVSLLDSEVVSFTVPTDDTKFTETCLQYAIKYHTGYDYDEFGYILSVNRIRTAFDEPPLIILNRYDENTKTYIATFADADEYSDGDKLIPSDEEWEEDDELTDTSLDEEILFESDESIINLSEPNSDEVNAMDEDESNGQDLQNVEDTVVEDEADNKTEIVLCTSETETVSQNGAENFSSVENAEQAEVAQQTETEMISFAENAGPAEAAPQSQPEIVSFEENIELSEAA